jgi:hypothetical protein
MDHFIHETAVILLKVWVEFQTKGLHASEVLKLRVFVHVVIYVYVGLVVDCLFWGAVWRVDSFFGGEHIFLNFRDFFCEGSAAQPFYFGVGD